MRDYNGNYCGCNRCGRDRDVTRPKPDAGIKKDVAESIVTFMYHASDLKTRYSLFLRIWCDTPGLQPTDFKVEYGECSV
ncbi:hypothetical protein TUM17576_44030 [Enterobacter hormaechei]|nr:hypothetical protein TUM17576_44030 [Enterobacter hormaechei]